MPELLPKKILIRNAMTFKKVELEFPPSGLVLVTGSNLASGGMMASVGAGKTGLGELLSRVLLNVPGRFTRIGDYSTHGRGDMYVRVEGTLNGQQLIVENGFKCPELNEGGEGIKFTLGEKVMDRSRIDYTKDELERILNVSPELAQWSVFIDGDRLRFGALTEKASVDLLISALSRQSWNDCHEVAKKRLETFKSTVLEHKASHVTLTQQEANLRVSVREAHTSLVTAQQLHQKAVNDNAAAIAAVDEKLKLHDVQHETSVKRVAQLKKEIKEIERTDSERYTEAENTVDGLSTQLQEAQAKKEDVVKIEATISANLTAAKEDLRKILAVPKFCPTCRKPWDAAISDEVVAEKTAVRDQRQVEYNTAHEHTQQWVAYCNQLDAQLKRAKQVRDSLRTVDNTRSKADELENHEAFLANAAIYKEEIIKELAQLQAGVDDSKVKAAQAVLDDRQDQLNKAMVRVQDKTVEIAESEAALKVVQYWTVAYSPVGVPNMLLEESIAPLNEISRRISTLLTGGLITISYATRKALKSGKDKASLQIKVDNKIGCKNLNGSSKGEAGLSNLIVAETLSEIGAISSRVGFRWYDEILNSQDDVVRRSILAYLKELAQRMRILIFIVDHHLETASYVDHVLVAEKGTDGFTTFRWR